ncbi:solute carrier family 10 member 6 [Trichonephila clavata]|uniref:Solute carrier family 10 member 6 n=1 Tax=Trichonephila clavata TaxID=2740835 RepID=A0A8X6EXF5_TRICU|nr:solute carrier family 10 member 6 [Trichonephila clavata]
MENNLNLSHEKDVISQETALRNQSCQVNISASENSIVQDVLLMNVEIMSSIDHLTLILLVVIMLSFSSQVTWMQLKNHIKYPTGIGIALVTQFFIKPLAAYALMRSSNIIKQHALMILVISACPGGVLSSVFAYFFDGDLSLSILITSISTFLSMGVMPINLWIYGHNFETKNLTLPYQPLALHLMYIITLLITGILLQWKFPSISNLLIKVGNYVGLIIVIICIILEILAFPSMFFDVPGKLYGVIFTLPLLGLFLGYILAYSFRQNIPMRKTIAIECGLQNIPCVLAIISQSFELEMQRNMILFPWLYAFLTTSGYTVFSIAYRIHKQYLFYKTKKENSSGLASIDEMTI